MRWAAVLIVAAGFVFILARDLYKRQERCAYCGEIGLDPLPNDRGGSDWVCTHCGKEA
jgi:transposase